MLLLLLGLALVGAQSPVTVGNGQYCSNYYGGNSNCEWFNDYYNSEQEYDAPQVCAPGGYCCVWAYGTGCSLVEVDSFAGNGRRRLLQREYTSLWDCAAGCVTAASCTSIPNAYFTGPASPVTSATACPFQCNTGYVKSGSSCTPSSSCQVGQFSSGGLCCKTCQAGQYTTGCSATSAGACTNCTN